MADRNVLKFALNEDGYGTILLNGTPIPCVTSLSYKAKAGELVEVTLRVLVEVDAEVDVRIDKLMIEREKFLDQ